MKRARSLRLAGTVAGVALVFVGCSKGDNPVLPPGTDEPEAGVGDRGVQLVPDAAPLEARPSSARDAGDVSLSKDGVAVDVLGVDLAPPPKLTVSIISPAAGGAVDGGIAIDGGTVLADDDGGAPVPVINAASRFAPVASIEVESRGGDPTTEVLSSVTASLVTDKGGNSVASATLNLAQYTVLPGSGNKSYLYANTPLNLSKAPSGFYDLVVTASTAGGTTASASVLVYLDGGPSISFLQPADGAYVKGSLTVTALVDDTQAGVTSVSFSVGQTELPANAISNSGVQYTATIDCNSFNPPLDGAQVVTVTAVNGNGIVSVAKRNFTVDNTGPAITATKPASGDFIGRIITIEASVTDPAGVMPGSVVAVVANGDIHFEVQLVLGTDGVYRQLFDTTQLPSYAISPSISFRAQDVLGNQSSVGYLVTLDNTPPIIDLDPPATFRLRRKSSNPPGFICSWPFDPVGPDAIDDGQVVQQVFDIRARIEDQGNQPLTGQLDFTLISTVDPASVKLLILDDATLPLAVDTSDPPDGICDDINPELVPSVSPQSSKDVLSIGLVTLPANAGAGDFTPMPDFPTSAYCTVNGSDQNSPDPFCDSTFSISKQQSLTYTLMYNVAKMPSIWTVGPVVTDGLQCAGRQFDASNNLKDGWACVAVEAADKQGNKQISRPLRVCLAAQPGSTACTADAMGGASIASVMVPSDFKGMIGFTTKTPLLGAGGVALKAGDRVAFNDVGPAGFINGMHVVTPADTTGTSFLITDVPAALAAHYSALVADKTMGTAVAESKLPNCTGTVVKQSNGLPAKIDSTKPCTPWAQYPQLPLFEYIDL